jgi:hypothetical protein
MRRLFENYIIVDWSAAAKPATGADSIWVGVHKRDVRLQVQYETHNPATRAEAVKLIESLLADFAKRGDRTLIGFDFPMGYPTGTAAALSMDGTPWEAMHKFLAKEIKDKPTNDNNRFAVAAMVNRRISGGPFPFWGCPPRDVITTLQSKKTRPHGPGDVPEQRACESRAKGASPVWKLYTAGSVGSQALMGIPVVHGLRHRHETSRIWPFETGWQAMTPETLSDVKVVLAEIYPSILKAVAEPGEVKDAAQVRTLGAHFAALDAEGKLGALFGPQAKGDEALRETVEGEEGWILGV